MIERQNKTLEKYQSISTNWQISIDEEQLQALKSSHTKLMLRLDALEKQLNEVLKKL
ncbi:MAG: hypothetical protein IE916_00035 [Epsilonproteobacteria bacterium]|nr:hypothetical protein [Campylobacterota bacterium]